LNTVQDLLREVQEFLAGTGGEQLGSFTSEIGWSMPVRDLPARPLPCLDHLDRIASIAGARGRPLASFLLSHGHALHWGQTYTQADFGQSFIDNYGWLELFGTRGHFANDAVAGGFLVLGPHIEYPDHHHVAEEIYIPLTGGTLWRMDGWAWRMHPAGAVIHHASNVSHAMRTGEEPLLAFYLWRGGPLAQRSIITGKAG
jgi:hypothetical protein